jgi:cell division protein FtsB
MSDIPSNVSADAVISDLAEQITRLTKENAILRAMIRKMQENAQAPQGVTGT